MRIIAGQFRGRPILAPKGDQTRPITDRAKQSLFDILAPLIPGAVVYDIFAGTGSLGLECLSRGCRHVTFFESERSAIALLNQNILALKAKPQSTVIPADALRWFQTSSAPKAGADLAFLDPPYRYLNERSADLERAAGQLAHHHLAPGALLVFRHDAKDKLPLSTFQLVESREYGSMEIEFLRPMPIDDHTSK